MGVQYEDGLQYEGNDGERDSFELEFARVTAKFIGGAVWQKLTSISVETTLLIIQDRGVSQERHQPEAGGKQKQHNNIVYKQSPHQRQHSKTDL